MRWAGQRGLRRVQAALPSGRGGGTAAWQARHRGIVALLGAQLVAAALLARQLADPLALGLVAATTLCAVSLYQRWAPFLLAATGAAALVAGWSLGWSPGLPGPARLAVALGHPGLRAAFDSVLLLSAALASLTAWRLSELHSLYDPLTGLPNRALFRDRLGHALSLAARRQAQIAVLFIDLDDFKPINDNLGHAAGDQVLRVAAQRLRAALRSSDTLARLGGDEFTALLEDLDDPLDALAVAERVDQALREPIGVHGEELRISASIGVAFSSPSADAEALLHDADTAMYAAKREGEGGYQVFLPGMLGETRDRFQLQHDLQDVTERDELVVHYQPIVELATGDVTGVEALLRWAHPTRGLLSPDEFVHTAEETGLIVQIGRWVLQHAVQQVSAWQRDHPGGAPLTMSVNVSARQLRRAQLIDEVRAALREATVDPATLTLEFTESAVMDDSEANIGRLHDLKRLGVRLALDDFGTGYSSLGYLRRFPVDAIKIDKSFTDDLPGGSNEAVLATTILHLAAKLNLVTVAEGIEHAEQAAWLRAQGCGWGQGYYYAKPLEPAAMEEFLRHGRAWAPMPPAWPAPPASAAPGPPATLLRVEGGLAAQLPSVLIVDDNTHMVTTIRRLLERNGFACSSAGTVAQAWAAIRGALPDFALVDIRLPDGDGWGLIERARADRRCHGLPIVVMTGLVDRGTIDRATAMACGYLGKPFDARSLLSALHQAHTTASGALAGRHG